MCVFFHLAARNHHLLSYDISGAGVSSGGRLIRTSSDDSLASHSQQHRVNHHHYPSSSSTGALLPGSSINNSRPILSKENHQNSGSAMPREHGSNSNGKFID